MRIRRLTTALLLMIASLAVLTPAEAITVGWTVSDTKQLADTAVAPGGAIYGVGKVRRSITVAATLRRYSAAGELRWSRSWLPDVQASTAGIGVAVGSDGTVYLLGSVQGQCEGGGWFIRSYSPGGRLRDAYVTPGWECAVAERATDIAVRGNLLVVSGYSHGCCGDLLRNGWVRAFSATLRPRWRTNVEPPAPTPAAWFDTAGGVAIGPAGNVYASGWAATALIEDETDPTPGTPFLAKLSGAGVRLWSVRAGVQLPSAFQLIRVSASADGIAVAGPIEGRGVAWGLNPTAGWLAMYSAGGNQQWERSWGGSRNDAAAPTGVVFGGLGRIWVLGTRRDADDRGTDVFVRRYDGDGSLHDGHRIDGVVRYLASGGIAKAGGGAIASGWVGDEYVSSSGRLWRLAG